MYVCGTILLRIESVPAPEEVYIMGLLYIRLLCFAVTEQLDMNIKSKKNINHIYNNTMQCNIIRGLHVVI